MTLGCTLGCWLVRSVDAEVVNIRLISARKPSDRRLSERCFLRHCLPPTSGSDLFECTVATLEWSVTTVGKDDDCTQKASMKPALQVPWCVPSTSSNLIALATAPVPSTALNTLRASLSAPADKNDTNTPERLWAVLKPAGSIAVGRFDHQHCWRSCFGCRFGYSLATLRCSKKRTNNINQRIPFHQHDCKNSKARQQTYWL